MMSTLKSAVVTGVAAAADFRRVKPAPDVDAGELRQLSQAQIADRAVELQQMARAVVHHQDPAVDGVAGVIGDGTGDDHCVRRGAEQVIVDLGLMVDQLGIDHKDDGAIGDLDRQDKALPELAGLRPGCSKADEGRG